MESNFKKLINEVVEKSTTKIWEYAVKEWEIFDMEEDENADSRCICGKENIRYLYTIINNINGEKLFPIGSTCIKKFNRTDLNEKTSLYESLIQLIHAVERKEMIKLKGKYFSRKLLKYFFEQGVFGRNPKYSAEENYKFMLKMFNKKDTDSVTEKTKSKIRAIIVNDIIPYAKEQIKNKFRIK